MTWNPIHLVQNKLFRISDQREIFVFIKTEEKF